MTKNAPPSVLRYGIALLTVSLATLLHILLLPVMPESLTLFFFVAVIVATWYGGFGPGILSSVLSTVALDYFLIEPLYSVSLSSANLIRLVIFLLLALSISLLTTARKQAEESQKKTLDRYQALVRASAQIVWTALPDGQVVDIPVWRVVTGQTKEEIKGWGWLDAIHPDDRDRTAQVWTQAVNTKSICETEYRVLGRNGDYRFFAMRGVPVFNEDRSIREWVGTCTDISEQKRAERERKELLAREQEAREMAERANRMKDDFLATLSHELRTPLNAIIGWSEMLRRNLHDRALVDRAVNVIHRNAKSQGQLIEDLLDVSQIITGKLQLDTRPAELSSIIDAGIDAMRPAAEAKGIQLEKRYDLSAYEISGDSARLQQVVLNLLSNAIKFTPEGGKVEVRITQVGSEVELTVSDTGQGISPEFLPYVFERFSQSDTSRAKMRSGLGLGLAIVRHVVELHGGVIEAYSAGLEQGSIFTMRLPLAAAENSTAEISERVTAAYDTPRLDGLKILLVDDHADTREVLAMMLGMTGAKVMTSTTAREAFETLKMWRPDLLVSDIGMPGEDGYALIDKIRRLGLERGGSTPALALTGYAGSEECERVLAAGFQAHIAKPIGADELIQAIATIAIRDTTGKVA